MATSPDDPNAAGTPAPDEDQGGAAPAPQIVVCIGKNADGTFDVWEDQDEESEQAGGGEGQGGEGEGQHHKAASVMEALHVARQLLEGGGDNEGQADADMAAGFKGVHQGGPTGMMGMGASPEAE